MTVRLVKVEQITLLWECPECHAQVEQPLSELADAGTAYCADCDCAMELEDNVRVTE